MRKVVAGQMMPITKADAGACLHYFIFTPAGTTKDPAGYRVGATLVCTPYLWYPYSGSGPVAFLPPSTPSPSLLPPPSPNAQGGKRMTMTPNFLVVEPASKYCRLNHF